VKYALSFIAMFATDWAWAVYVCAASEKKAVKAGAYSAVIVLLGAVTTVIYVGDHLAIIPATLGAFCGTLWGVRRG
jgi:hypothetical protein